MPFASCFSHIKVSIGNLRKEMKQRIAEPFVQFSNECQQWGSILPVVLVCMDIGNIGFQGYLLKNSINSGAIASALG